MTDVEKHSVSSILNTIAKDSWFFHLPDGPRVWYSRKWDLQSQGTSDMRDKSVFLFLLLGVLKANSPVPQSEKWPHKYFLPSAFFSGKS